MLDYKVGRRKVRWFALNGGVDHHLYFRLKGTTEQSMAHVRTFKNGYELIVTEKGHPVRRYPSGNGGDRNISLVIGKAVIPTPVGISAFGRKSWLSFISSASIALNARDAFPKP